MKTRLTAEWRAWVAENLLVGVDAERLLGVLMRAGVDEALARAELEAAGEHPYLRAAQRVVWRGEKARSLLELYGALERASSPGPRLERRVDLSPAEFFERYYAANQPVVITGLARDWPAVRKWSLPFFRETIGDAVIEIMQGRESDPDPEVNRDRLRRKIRLREFIDLLESGRETNDYYMMARNYAWETDGLRPLHDDIRLPKGLIAPSDARRTGEAFWLGPAGTVTPLHHDPVNVLFVQVFGRKRFKLVPSYDLPFVYNNRSWYSPVDPVRPDAGQFPAFGKARVLETVLEPGDAIFLPVGWWHWVKGLEVSASMTFRRFAIPEENTWWMPPGHD